jgi:hypothetical protein
VFDAICLRSTTDPQSEPLDLGLLAEALMFYGTVDLVLNRAFLNQLMNALGPDELVEFTQLDGIKVSYCNQFDVVLTENTGTVAERYFLGTAEMPHTRLDQLSTELFRGALGKSGKGRRLAERFLTFVPEVRLDGRLHVAATEDALAAGYAAEAAASILRAAAPGYAIPSPLVFQCERVDANGLVDRIVVHSNLDLVAANKYRHPGFPEITPASLLNPIVTALTDVALASRLRAELATNEVVSNLVKAKAENLFATSSAAKTTRQEFQELVFSDAHAIREAVNSGARSLHDAVTLARKARKFRSWLANQPPDADLLHEYYQASVSGSWADRLSTKALRWLVVTGGGTATGALLAPPLGAAIGPVVGTADALQDALVKGWKPHQFVEKKLRGFVERA